MTIEGFYACKDGDLIYEAVINGICVSLPLEYLSGEPLERRAYLVLRSVDLSLEELSEWALGGEETGIARLE